MLENNQKFHMDSMKIVKDFIRNVVVLDDLVFNKTDEKVDNTAVNDINQSPMEKLAASAIDKSKIQIPINHKISTQNLINAFIKEGILCSCISPNINEEGFSSEEEKQRKTNELYPVLSKADIVILDWQTYNDDKNGELTCELLKKFKEDSDIFRLLIIYTGTNVRDNIMPKIPEIFEFAPAQVENIFKREHCCFKYNSLIVKVILKNDSTTEPGDLDIKKVEESLLPAHCIEEFTQITEGLILNAVLSVITDIRNNIYRVLSLIKKEYDASFINHRMLLPSPADANLFLSELLSEKITGLINISKFEEIVSEEQIDNWFNYNQFDEMMEDTVKIPNINCLQAIKQGLFNILKDDVPADIIEIIEKDKKLSFTKHFADKMKFDPDKTDKEFAALSITRETIYSEKYTPDLTLGTIIKTKNNSRYYLCLQPRCDSVRVDDKCNFILLHLAIVNDDKLPPKLCIYDKVQKKAILFRYTKINSIELKSFKEEYIKDGKVKFKYNQNKYIVESNENNEYIWVADLKFAYAQKIVQEYANNICRVGFDEYEWFRKLQK